MKKIILFSIVFLFLFPASAAFAHQPRIIYYNSGEVNISEPEISQAFYDELKGSPRHYFINSDKDFELYINLLTPEFSNPGARYSANIFLMENGAEKLVFFIEGSGAKWEEFYEEFGRDYYLKGPELTEQVKAGNYKIEVFSGDNSGKYVLAVGKKEAFGIKSLLNVYWQLPLLKITFFKTSVMQFFLTPFGIGLIAVIGAILIIFALANYFSALIRDIIKHNQAKTLLLTSAGMEVKDEIIKLLQKPAYDVNVAFINVDGKSDQDDSLAHKDLWKMRDIGFNVEEIDVEEKSQGQLLALLEVKDIIFVEGRNAFHLMAVLKKCGFEKIMAKLLKQGKVYIGAEAGSIVAGQTLKTGEWAGQKDISGKKIKRGLSFVPFDVFVCYKPENAEIIKQKIPKPKKRKKLKILTDEQALLVQGKNVILLGKGEEVVV